MTDMKCKHCGNSYHWHHAFAKFGYDDGDGKIQTPYIASILEEAGYTVQYSHWSLHNTIISSIAKDGIEYMPLGNPRIFIGYDDPATYLPLDIQILLDDRIPPTRIFP